MNPPVKSILFLAENTFLCFPFRKSEKFYVEKINNLINNSDPSPVPANTSRLANCIEWNFSFPRSGFGFGQKNYNSGSFSPLIPGGGITFYFESAFYNIGSVGYRTFYSLAVSVKVGVDLLYLSMLILLLKDDIVWC